MNLNLEEIKARCEALRHDKGSWHADDYGGIVWGGPNTINDGRICDIRGWGHLTGGGALGLKHDEAAATQDARKAFIAHARTDVPALVAEVERLRAALDAILNIVSPENDPDDHSLTVEGIVDNVREMRDLLHATMKERDAERKACDDWRAMFETNRHFMPTKSETRARLIDNDCGTVQYQRSLGIACDKHDARRAAENINQPSDADRRGKTSHES